MNQNDRTNIKELAPMAAIEVQGYLSVVTEELMEIEQETGNKYGTLVTYHGTESFVRVTNLTKKPSLRVQVEKALEQITQENPITIPSGKLAAQYAYAYAKQRGVRYRIKNGTVCLAESLSLRAQVLQTLEELTEDNPVQIPCSAQAANYAYAHLASIGKKCSIRNGKVTLAKEGEIPLRARVFIALEDITEDNPVTIPLGSQAAQYAYAHARARGLRYKITSSGVVSIATKAEEKNKIELLRKLLNLEKGETITEQVTQAYLRKVEDVSGYGFLLNDREVTRLK